MKQTKLEPNSRVKSKNATVDGSVVSGDPPSDAQPKRTIHKALVFMQWESLRNSSKFFVVCFCSLLRPWPCTKHNSCLLCTEARNQLIETCWLRNSCIVYEHKAKVSTGSWTIQHKFWHLCFFLWCLPGFMHNLSLLSAELQTNNLIFRPLILNCYWPQWPHCCLTLSMS